MSAPSAAARRNSGSSPVPSPTNSAGRSLVDKTGPVTADWTFFSNQEVNNAPSFGSAYRGPPTQSYEVHEVKRYSVDAGELPRQRSNSLTQEGPPSGSRSPSAAFAALTALPPRAPSFTLDVPRTASERSPGHTPRSYGPQPPSPTNHTGVNTGATNPTDWSVFMNQQQQANTAPSFESAHRGPPTQSYETHEVKRYSIDLGELPRQRSNSLTQEGPLSGSRSPGFAAVAGGLPPRTSSVSPGVPRTASERSPAYTPRSTGSQPHSPTVGSDGVRRSSVDMGATHPTDWSVFMNQQQQPAAPRSTEGTPRGPPTQSYETHETRRYSVDIDHLPRRDSNSSAFPPLPPQDGTTTTESHEVLKYSAAQ